MYLNFGILLSDHGGSGGTHTIPGGGIHPIYTDEEFMAPILDVIDWIRTNKITIAEHTFTLGDIILYGILVLIVFWFIFEIYDNS